MSGLRKGLLKANELCRAYKLDTNNAQTFASLKPAVLDKMKEEKNKLKFNSLVNSDVSRLSGLIKYLSNCKFFEDNNDAFEVLAGLNDKSGQKWVAPPCSCLQCTLQYWRALVKAMTVTINYTALFRELLALDGNILCRFYSFLPTVFNQAEVRDVLLMLHRLRHECHISAQRMIALLQKTDGLPIQVRNAWRLYPNGGAFDGFKTWGSGNHRNAQANMVWHFYKHVCGVSEIRTDVNDVETASETFPEECKKWWELLNIRIPTAVLQRSIGRAWKQVEPLLVGVDGGSYLDHTHAELFIKRGYLHSALPLYLYENYATAYQQFAIDRSKRARRVYVEGTRARVFINCFCDNDVYVVGRLNGRVFEISSCYILLAPDKKEQSIQQNAYWTLQPS